MIDHCHGFILHKKTYRDTSLLIDVFSVEHGILRAVAKGGRKKSLHLFTPFWFELNLRQELSSIYKAEAEQAAFILEGNGLIIGYYINELLSYLLYRYDPQPKIYQQYSDLLQGLALNPNPIVTEQMLRRFELLILKEIGYQIDFSHDADTGAAIDAVKSYQFVPAQGFKSSLSGLSGADILALAKEELDTTQVLQVAKYITRAAINHLLEGKTIKSRSLFAAH
jgi:DNA repair protein RecO (recombination protein O)